MDFNNNLESSHAICEDKLYINYGNNSKQMIKKIFNKYTPFPNLDKSSKIALKPNLILPSPAEQGATTCPELVKGIIEHFQDRGYYNIIIMESSWLGANTNEAFHKCGFTDISEQYKVKLVDLKSSETSSLSSELGTVEVANQVKQIDRLINIPVLKAHCQTQLTCALKNLKGCIPDREKRKFHNTDLHTNIAILNTVLKPDLHVVDSMYGDLTFEEGGNPVNLGRVIVGKDPVLVDSYGCELLGIIGENLPNHIESAYQMGVGDKFRGKEQLVEFNLQQKQDQQVAISSAILKLQKYVDNRESCSPCIGAVFHALMRLQECNELPDYTIAVGQQHKNMTSDSIILGVGNCTRNYKFNVPGCPPSATDIIKRIRNF